jgi:hypothetical protein
MRGMTNGRNITRAVKGCSNIKPFTQTRNFHSGCYATNLRDVDADEIKPLVNHWHFKFIDIVEQLTHRDRN